MIIAIAGLVINGSIIPHTDDMSNDISFGSAHCDGTAGYDKEGDIILDDGNIPRDVEEELKEIRRLERANKVYQRIERLRKIKVGDDKKCTR